MFGSPWCGYHSCLTAHFPTDGTSFRYSKRTNHGLFDANGTLIGLLFFLIRCQALPSHSHFRIYVWVSACAGVCTVRPPAPGTRVSPPDLPRFFVIIIPLLDCAHVPSTNDCACSPGPHTQIITHTVVYSAPENYRDSLAPLHPHPPLSPSSCVHGRGVSQESRAGVGIRWRTFCDLTHPPVDGARKGRRRRKKGGF